VYTIAATYANDANFNGSSASVSQKVNAKPIFTSASSTSATVSRPFSFQVTATGYPVPTFSESGRLPTGVTFNATTGVLSGTPAAGTAGTYTIIITATNSAGSTSQTFKLTVASH
jgi:large repetitive protein